jgi:hypothetical protein
MKLRPDIGLFMALISNLANASNASVMQLHQSLGLGGSSGAVVATKLDANQTSI